MAWVGPVALAVAAPGEPAVLDAFEDRQAWTAAPATDVGLALAGAPGIEGNALCLDIDFRGHGGYAVAKRALPIALPENYALSFWMRGDIPPNNLELKLADASGDNVWWVNRRDVAFPAAWTKVTYRKRHVEFAWGPARGGELREAASIQFAVTAGPRR